MTIQNRIIITKYDLVITILKFELIAGQQGHLWHTAPVETKI